VSEAAVQQLSRNSEDTADLAPSVAHGSGCGNGIRVTHLSPSEFLACPVEFLPAFAADRYD